MTGTDRRRAFIEMLVPAFDGFGVEAEFVPPTSVRIEVPEHEGLTSDCADTSGQIGLYTSDEDFAALLCTLVGRARTTTARTELGPRTHTPRPGREHSHRGAARAVGESQQEVTDDPDRRERGRALDRGGDTEGAVGGPDRDPAQL